MKYQKVALLAAGLLLSASGFSQSYESGFANPPQEARIRVWWHWMDSNVSKDGIKKDLDWMKATGIGGVRLLFNSWSAKDASSSK